jgi:FdhD protein
MKRSYKTVDIIADEVSDNNFNVIRCYRDRCFNRKHTLVREEPLMIRIEGHSYSTVMRTPGEEIHHTAGFCLSEGIVENTDDFLSIGFGSDMDPNVVDIRLDPSRRKHFSFLVERRDSRKQTNSGIGICSKNMVEEICKILKPVIDETRIGLKNALRLIKQLPRIQPMHKKTYGSHAVILLNSRSDILAVAEDVGRHNAFDKAIGKLLMSGKLNEASIGVLSSRISYEMIQKATRAHIPILLSASRPTALAVHLGKRLNMTLACAARESELIIFCGEWRINR